MEHLIQPNDWSCLITSFAMALHTTVDKLIKMVGHDGSTRVWPNLPEPQCRQSFHMQEMADCCHELGYYMTPIELQPSSIPTFGNYNQLMDKLGNCLEEQDLMGASATFLEIEKLAQIPFKLPIINRKEYVFRFDQYLYDHPGVLYGRGLGGTPHAVAWDNIQGNILCPSGRTYYRHRFFSQVFYIVDTLVY